MRSLPLSLPLFLPLYAEVPARRARQAAGDVLLLVWIAAWCRVAAAVHGAVGRTAEPGRRLESSGHDLAGRLQAAGESVGDLPVVGDRAGSPLREAGEAAARLAGAGRAEVDAVGTLAFWLALATAVLPAVLALVLYVPGRVRFARRVRDTRRLLATAPPAAAADLLALRALARRDLGALVRTAPDPAGRWRVGDPVVVRSLAELELRDAGLVPPPSLRFGPGPRI